MTLHHYIHIPKSYLTQSKICLHYQDQSVNVFWEKKITVYVTNQEKLYR